LDRVEGFTFGSIEDLSTYIDEIGELVSAESAARQYGS
jgi:hypothetical protein